MKTRLGIALWLTFCASTILATQDQWSPIGPAGGSVQSIAVHPTEPGIAWAALGTGGLFRTRDSGSTWQKLTLGRGADSFVAVVAADPVSARTLLVASLGIFRSDDGGDSWVPVARPGSSPVYGLAISSGFPSIMFAATYGGLYRSPDRGATWTLVWSALLQPFVPQSVFGVTADPTNSNVIYATAGESGILKSTDGGVTFTARNGPSQAASLIVDPAHPNVLYAAMYQSGALRSDDGGATWEFLYRLPDPRVRSIALDPGRPGAVWVASDGGGIYHSTDRGSSWSSVDIGLTNPFGNVIIFGAGGYVGYAGFNGAGVFRSTNHGEGWSQSHLVGAEIQRLLWSGTGLLAAVRGAGIERTSDGGSYWSIGAITRNNLEFDGSVVANNFEFNAMAVSLNYPNPAVATSGGIFIGYNEGTAWAKTLVGDCQSVTFGAGDGATVYAALRTLEILRSQDRGVTWTIVSTFSGTLPLGTGVQLRADPAKPGVVLAGMTPGGLLRSEDGGLTWKRTSYPRDRVEVIEFDATCASAIEFDTTCSSYVYASDSSDFFRSFDGGVSWTQGGTIPAGARALATIPGHEGSVYAGMEGSGVLITTDFGETWSPVGSGLPTVPVTAIVVDPNNSTRVYAATDGGGVFEIDHQLDGGSGCVSGGKVLCLNRNRFRVRASWRLTSQETFEQATVVRLTGDTGYFWFFSPNNVELAVKIVDGTAVNGKFWFFSAALSNVEYVIEVYDPVTSISKTYTNPQGTLASLADLSAF